MRDEYLQKAREIIPDPNILVNVVSRRVKQLRRGARPLVESLEKLAIEDIALREVYEGKIGYELAKIVEAPAVQNARPSSGLRKLVSSPSQA
jgi:DNA-directed RNA polymerase subunit omega